MKAMHAHEEIYAALVVHRAELLRYARRFLGWNPEDLYQATALRALENTNLFMPGSQARAWLYRIMHNLAVNEQRRSAHGARLLRDGCGKGAHTQGVPHDEDVAITRIDLVTALDALPDVFGEALAAWWRNPEPMRERALPLGTSCSRVRRARLRVTAALSEVAAPASACDDAP